MMRLRPLVVCAILVTALVVCAVPGPASATTLLKMSVDQLAQTADSVLVVTVSDSKAHWKIDARTKRKTSIETVTDCTVLEVLKGRAKVGDVVKVRVAGGKAGNTQQIISGLASFAPGERCAVFLDQRGRVVGGFQGKIPLPLGVAKGSTTLADLNAQVGRRDAEQRRKSQPKSAAPKPSLPQFDALFGIPPWLSATPTESTLALAGTPVISSITPSTASAGTSTRVTILGQSFGSAPGRVWFAYEREYVGQPIEAPVITWSDSSIVCEVPCAIINNYPASAGTGPVVVETADGAQSAGFPYQVPFGYGGISWQTNTVGYRVNENYAPLGAQAKTMVQAGAAVWNAAGSAFNLPYLGSSTEVDIVQDGQNDISWTSLEPGVLAHASGFLTNDYLWWSECDLSFNDYYSWGDGTGGTFDVQSTCVHEMGHWLRLLDQYCDNDSAKAMFGFGSPGEVKRTLAAGDIAGVQWVYPVSASRIQSFGDVGYGGAGDPVTLLGRNLGSSGAVTFGGVPASTSSWTSTKVVCTVPAGLAEGPVQVRVQPTAGAVSNPLTYWVERVVIDFPNDIPGAPLPPSPVTQTLDKVGGDTDDVLSIYLSAGQWVRLDLTGDAGTDFDMYLFAPGTLSVAGPDWEDWVVAYSDEAGSDEMILYQAPVAGTYYIDLYAYGSGVGSYSLSWGLPDRTPSLSLAAPSTIAFGGTATLKGKLLSDVGAAIAGADVWVQAKMLGAADWSILGSLTTGADGSYSAGIKLPIKTSFRSIYLGDFDFVPVISATKTVIPKAYVRTPVAPTTMSRSKYYTVYGYLKPRHTAGSYPVRIYKYRLVSGKWRSYGYITAKASNYSTYTKYARSIRLPYAGRWRLRAYHGDSGHAASWSSGYDYVTVK